MTHDAGKLVTSTFTTSSVQQVACAFVYCGECVVANIREVAKRAGVSIATVSHVYNGTRPVSEEVRHRVQQAATDLRYYPNFLARSLTTKKTGTVGMVVSHMSNPFFAELIH